MITKHAWTWDKRWNREEPSSHGFSCQKPKINTVLFRWLLIDLTTD